MAFLLFGIGGLALGGVVGHGSGITGVVGDLGVVIWIGIRCVGGGKVSLCGISGVWKWEA